MGKRTVAVAAAALVGGCAAAYSAPAQSGVSPRNLPEAQHVLTRPGDAGPAGPLTVDRGAVGVRLQLLRLRTTASLLYTAGHPDDEQAGVLTLLSRGKGVRTGLLTLNRGEGGANAIGPELFDALGLIRTEELRLSGRYYGLDDQYFTTAVDYGYSKTLDEAFRSWDRERVLGDMVRIIRINRPLVVVSRWHGSERDGHGHHQAAGVLTPEAVRAAGDPTRFPEQITREGLRPWTPLRLYRGGVREGERTQVAVDPDVPSPWLGQSYQAFGAYGLSLQRSQTAGRMRSGQSASVVRYERLPIGGDELATPPPGSEPARGFFADLDVTLPALPDLLGEPASDTARALLEGAEREVEWATRTFRVDNPSGTLQSLVRGLSLIRETLTLMPDSPETRFQLHIKERQFEQAIRLASDLRLTARALELPSGNGTVVPGQTFDVEVTAAPLDPRVQVRSIALSGLPGWTRVSTNPPGLDPGAPAADTFRVRVPHYESPGEPYFFRSDIRQNHYHVADSTMLGLAERPPLLTATIHYSVLGVEIATDLPVTATESDAPYGQLSREVSIIPAVSVTADPPVRMFPTGRAVDPIPIRVSVTNHHPEGSSGQLRLDGPVGWSVDPPTHPFALTSAGQSQTFVFQVRPLLDGDSDVVLRPAAAVPHAERGNKEYYRGFETIRHRDLGTRRLYRDANVTLRAVDVRLAPDLEVGYVMGVGDRVPDAIQQLGARVTLLDAEDVASGDLSRFQTIVLGTRAYAVRPGLTTHGDRLLEWAAAGGNLVVLYQTQEFRPQEAAPFPALLPPGAEEVSEEDAPVQLVAPEHPLLTTPNRIAPEDFQDWVEQRGSKFWTQWDAAYTALIETHDTGQPQQQGVWLTARHGLGRYTYVALALHRQLPYGVPGAYRILANLLTPPDR